MKNHAFTLIELLVVVLIIGILSAIALPQYQKAVARSRAVQGMVYLRAIMEAQKEYKLANGKYSGNTDELSINFNGVWCSANDEFANCNFGVPGVVSFQWVGYHSGNWRYECTANKNNTIGKQLCENYRTEWGGSASYTSGDSIVYMGAGQP